MMSRISGLCKKEMHLMKKQIARWLLVCMLLSVFAVLPALPTGADEPLLTTDKTTYRVGESIMVTATGSGADWVGLYLADEPYDSNNGGMVSIFWYYVAKDGNTSGGTKDITKADYDNIGVRTEFANGLPVGEYKIVLMENDGFKELDRVYITVTDEDTPPEEPTEERPVVTNRTVYEEGEDIIVKALGSGKDWVGIYLRSDTVGQVSSVYWFYVEEGEYKAGDARKLQDGVFNDSRADLASLPAGDYTVFLLADDGYDIIGSIDITVKASPSSIKPDAPKTASYKSADAGIGRADGTLSIIHGSVKPESYVIRWGNANGALAGYTDVAILPCTDTTTVYTMTPNTLIPAGADRLLVYAKNGDALSDRPAVAALPAGAGQYDLGKNLGELQVMSDIHINGSDSHIHNKHFAAALADIKQQSPNSMGIFVNGDVADHGQRGEYDALNRLIHAAGAGLPPVLCAIGNHDLGGGQSAEAQIAQFLKGTNNDSETVYFEREVGGYRFVFLGGESTSLYASLSDAQLDWLEKTLDKGSDGKPVFVFLHQGVMNTVAGTFEYQGWHGVEQTAQLRRILKSHPEVIMFAGHSHWTLESEQSIKPADSKFPTVLNTAACAYLWDDAANITNQGIEGSQGYYITIYEKAIVFRGRDFAGGLWTSPAQFILSWDLGNTEDPSEETTPAETGDETADETTDETTDETVCETVYDTVGDETVTPDALESAQDTAAETDAPDAGGCASLAGVGVCLAMSAVGVLLGRRKD